MGLQFITWIHVDFIVNSEIEDKEQALLRCGFVALVKFADILSALKLFSGEQDVQVPLVHKEDSKRDKRGTPEMLPSKSLVKFIDT